MSLNIIHFPSHSSGKRNCPLARNSFHSLENDMRHAGRPPAPRQGARPSLDPRLLSAAKDVGARTVHPPRAGVRIPLLRPGSRGARDAPPTAGRARIRCRPFSGCICAACLTLSSTERHAFPVVHAVGQVASLAQGEPAGGRTLSGRSLRKRRGSQQRGHAAWPPWAVGQALRGGPFPRVLSPSTATPRLAFRAVFHPCGVILAV